jgi:hypothetical protein
MYKTLADLPVVPDLVDVFRRPQDLPAVLNEVLALGAGVRTLWLQFGLFDEAVARRAESAGLEVVMDRCLKVEHARFHSGLRIAGFDTGVISARPRPVRGPSPVISPLSEILLREAWLVGGRWLDSSSVSPPPICPWPWR